MGEPALVAPHRWEEAGRHGGTVDDRRGAPNQSAEAGLYKELVGRGYRGGGRGIHVQGPRLPSDLSSERPGHHVHGWAQAVHGLLGYGCACRWEGSNRREEVSTKTRGTVKMRTWLRGVMIAVALATVTTGVFLSLGRPIAGQTQGSAYSAPRGGGKPHPDLSGIWQTLTTANWDIKDHTAQPGPFPALLGAWGAEPAGQGIVESGELPYKPEALAKKKANYGKRLAVEP